MLRKNAKGNYECAICHMEYDNVRQFSLHISLGHKKTTQEYYDEFCKEPGEGTCKVCGQPTKFRSLGEGYKETCSHKCGSILLKSDPEKMAAKKAKTEATCMARYGVTNAGGTKESLEKAQKTNLEKRGVKWNMQSKEVVEKSKTTCLEKYGTTTFVHSDEGTSRVTATVQVRFGRDNFFSGTEGYTAAKAGMQARYGAENPMHVPEILEAHLEADRARNGGKLFVQTEEFKEQSRYTQFERYGNWYSASIDGKENAIARYNEGMKEYGCHIEKMTDKDHVTIVCARCGHRNEENTNFIKFRISHGITPCSVCYNKSMPTSAEEAEVSDFIKSLGFEVSHYDRNFIGTGGADIVVEDKKVIIEYDGIHWHSEKYRESTYHARKTRLASEKGYRMIHVFSDEWQYSNDIVRYRLANILGKWDYNHGIRMFARDCMVKEVDSVTADTFLKHNHLQGAIVSKWRIGLFNGDELVSLMTFGKNRFSAGTEMHRFCSKLGVSVVGGGSKLFKYFVNMHPEITEIVSFADARWSTGDAFYTKLGFELESMSEPGYFIVDGDVRRNRMNYQRHKLAGPGDEGKTEHEITLERGLFRIYDCGQLKYRWTRKEAGNG